MNEQYLINTIKSLTVPNVVPAGVTFIRLRKAVLEDLAQALNALYAEKAISVRPTVNGDKIINVLPQGDDK